LNQQLGESVAAFTTCDRVGIDAQLSERFVNLLTIGGIQSVDRARESLRRAVEQALPSASVIGEGPGIEEGP
jgi:hypothetical protein